jgi:hypothetical protein
VCVSGWDFQYDELIRLALLNFRQLTVKYPPATAAARAKRLSIAFFHQPNYNALIGRCGYARFPASSLNQDTPFGRLVQRVGTITSVPHWADCTIRSSEFDFGKAQEELKWNPITILCWA